MPTILPYGGVTPKIDNQAFVAETAVITGDVEIGAKTGIWYGCVMRGDVNNIRIGEGVNIQDGTIVHVSRPYGTVIENNVTIGHMALIHACTLEEGCFIGMKACVMDGAVVEKGALVAAGALVTPGKRVGAGEMWAGSPAKYLRDVNDKDREMMNYVQPNYEKLAQEYKDIESEHL
jgi:carbonic anhydrase/acetyltransferase-like protein (isoleucine patch superfamily)